MFSFFKRAVCIHDWKLLRSRVTGATLGWSLKPERQFAFDYECTKCGHTKVEDGFVVPGDRRRHPEAYNDDGWPIDEHGNKLEIAE